MGRGEKAGWRGGKPSEVVATLSNCEEKCKGRADGEREEWV